MTLTINDTTMLSDQSAHTALQAPTSQQHDRAGERPDPEAGQ